MIDRDERGTSFGGPRRASAHEAPPPQPEAPGSCGWSGSSGWSGRRRAVDSGRVRGLARLGRLGDREGAVSGGRQVAGERHVAGSSEIAGALEVIGGEGAEALDGRGAEADHGRGVEALFPAPGDRGALASEARPPAPAGPARRHPGRAPRP